MAEVKTLAAALCAAQAKMQNPKKDKVAKVRTRTGSEYSYNYTTLDAVLEVVRPALNSAGLFLWQHSDSSPTGMFLHTCVMFGTETLELDVTPYQYDTDPQEFGKRETYARRYSLLKAFGLAGDDDTDGDTGAGGTPPPKRAKKPADIRKKRLARLAELATRCIENGMNAGATDDYMQATFGVDTADKLTDEQIVEFGTYLSEMVKQSESLKGDTDEH